MDDDQLLLDAYVDGELDPAHALEFERRLAADPSLAEELSRIEALRGALRARLPRATASPALRRRVAAMARPRPASSRRGVWAAMAASALLAFAGGAVATSLVLGPARDRLPEALVESHMRALLSDATVDVASSDRHVVKPWFTGRLPGSPRVVDLTAQGFALVGGRIDVIGLTPVPTLVYRVRRHVISVTALPPAGRAAPPRTVNGYNVVAWSDEGAAFWAVSDLAAPELETFVSAFRAGTAEP